MPSAIIPPLFVSVKHGWNRCACSLLPSSDLIRHWGQNWIVCTSVVATLSSGSKGGECGSVQFWWYFCFTSTLQDSIARGDHQQHHLQRLKLQRSEEADSLPSPARRQQQQQQQELPADIDNGLPNSPWDFCEPLNHKDRRDHNSQQACHGIIWSSVRADWN